MIWVDWCIVLVVAISVAIGLVRGFTREVFGLITWLLAFWLAWAFGDDVAAHLQSSITVPSVRQAASYGILFFVGLVLGAMSTAIFVNAIKFSPFAGSDRMVGAGFGLLRGIALVTLFVMFAGMTTVHEDPWWRTSFLIGHIEWLADGVARLLPQELVELLKADAQALQAEVIQ